MTTYQPKPSQATNRIFYLKFYKLKKKTIGTIVGCKEEDGRDLFLYTWVTPFMIRIKFPLLIKEKKKMVEIYSLVN